MKIGICSPQEHWSQIKTIGYDFAEGYFRGITIATQEDFKRMCEFQGESGISVEVCNGIFGNDIPLYEGKESDALISDYLEKGFYRTKLLGGEVTVFGSGAARRIPDGMETERAKDRFAQVLYLAGDIAKKNGMQLALEPLSYRETNFINTLSDGIDICKYTGHPNVGITLDFFHFYSNGEDLATIADASPYLFHAHLARPNPDRKAPTATDLEECRKWAEALRSIGYDKRISLEAIFSADLIADCKQAYPVMQLFK